MNITVIIRISSLGDVAILLPALYTIATENPNDRFFFITLKQHRKIFVKRPSNIQIISLDTKKQDKGIAGIFRLAITTVSLIRKYIKYSGVSYSKANIRIADMHSVLRSHIFRILLKIMILRPVKTAIIDKGRREKAALCRPENKVLKQLKTTYQRYLDTFARIGYKPRTQFKSIYPERDRNNLFNIGIAPMAGHPSKTWSLENMEELIRILTENPRVRIFLFSTPRDKYVKMLTGKYPHVYNSSSESKKPQELGIMNRLDVMVSMDSANMHLASLVAVPVISIWCSTHPYAGFYGYGQDPSYAILPSRNLSCHPCSVYGNVPCPRGDYACKKTIDVGVVKSKIWRVISATKPKIRVKKTKKPIRHTGSPPHGSPSAPSPADE
ncbi:MAG: hypothetical protein LBS54_03155 [Dysgonamonadaceae bacterium]|jgi:ADP-heptose:LPS heptosyltransferase|nr:hypothetical protein [Dysgonamonadaceae bacterium]